MVMGWLMRRRIGPPDPGRGFACRFHLCSKENLEIGRHATQRARKTWEGKGSDHRKQRRVCRELPSWAPLGKDALDDGNAYDSPAGKLPADFNRRNNLRSIAPENAGSTSMPHGGMMGNAAGAIIVTPRIKHGL